MWRLALTGTLTLMIAAALLFAPPFKGFDRVRYALDQRPEASILFIGNGRISQNDMPTMVRRLADSAGYEKKLRIAVHAPGDASMTEHAANPRVHELIAQGWDHVVLQAQSTEQIDTPNWGKWWPPTTDLIKEVQQSGATPWMLVTWRYADHCVDDPNWTTIANDAMHTSIQQQHAHLERRTEVNLVNVGVVWDMLARKEIDFPLYMDCSRPSIYGSYLSALMLYNKLLDGNIGAVTYKPRVSHRITPQACKRLLCALSRVQTHQRWTGPEGAPSCACGRYMCRSSTALNFANWTRNHPMPNLVVPSSELKNSPSRTQRSASVPAICGITRQMSSIRQKA
jgi:hypothetical protein